MKNRFIVLAAVLLTALTTYGITRSMHTRPSATAAPRTSADESGEHEGEQVSISGLKLQPAVTGEAWDVVQAAGKVVPNTDRLVKIGPRISGKVREVRVNVGDTVRSGQVLATISSVELAQARAAYRQAAARLQAAEQVYRSQSRLAQLGAFTKRPVEEAMAEHTAAHGELSQAQGELAQNQSELVRVESELAQCVARLQRTKELYKDQIVSRNDLEAAEAEYKRDSADVESAKARIKQTQAKIDQVRSRVGIASDYLAREQKVAGSNLLSTRELQAARAGVNEARVGLSAAADTIRVLGASPSGSGETITIVSPISGRVVDRNVSLGEMVQPSDVLFTVIDLSDVWVEASVFEKDLAGIRAGQPAEIRVNSYPDRVFTGRVSLVSDLLDAPSRTARVRIAVANGSGSLKPEMFASVGVVRDRRRGAVLIPGRAVLDDGGKKIVFVACADCPEDKRAARSVCGGYDKREVEIGTRHGSSLEVAHGIAPGEEVVVEGQHQLRTALGSGKLKAGCADEH
jgi:RND family efflux transporter MFP subunit